MFHRLMLLVLLCLFWRPAHAQTPSELSPATKALLERAEAGDVEAQFRLATAYDWGEGAPRDGDAALRWYRRAAEAGDAEAQNSLGSALQAEGKYEEAKQWYERAAAQDHDLGTNNLGGLYDRGLGVPQDRKKALELFLRSAELGWSEAMWNIANLYGAGYLGDAPDFFMACVWSTRAIAHSGAGSPVHDRAAPALRYTHSRLSKTDRERCRTEAAAWTPRASARTTMPPAP